MRGRRRSPLAKRKRLKQTSSRGEVRDAVILFVDVVGCSEISNNKTIGEYNSFINEFQEYFNAVCGSYEEQFYKRDHRFFQYEPRGDEGCLKIFVSKKNDLLARDIDVAIAIALDLKRGWLMTKYNRSRIKQRLLPVDLAVGIHFGKVYVKEEKAEGYAINLAKRIESTSREGKFTHILLSESAHGHLDYLNYEKSYKFDQPSIKKAKGISSVIKAVEIKHHFLPTDWEDTFPDKPEETSILFEKYSLDDILKVFRNAYEINPNNLWLAEEYIYLMILNVGSKLRKTGREDDVNARKRAYAPVAKIARRIVSSDLRDATLLSIWGQILGLIGDYAKEEEKYIEAIELDKTDGDFYWYRGLCISYQLRDEYKKAKVGLKKFYDDIGNRKRINKVFEDYKKAMELKPTNSDIEYDYASELSWWSPVKKKYKKEAVRIVKRLLKIDPELKAYIEDEEYFKPILSDLN